MEESPYRGQARYARSVAQERVSAVLALEVSAKRTSNAARGAEKLIAEMAVANITWGEERIAHELLVKLGVRVSPRTVRK